MYSFKISKKHDNINTTQRGRIQSERVFKARRKVLIKIAIHTRHQDRVNDLLAANIVCNLPSLKELRSTAYEVEELEVTLIWAGDRGCVVLKILLVITVNAAF